MNFGKALWASIASVLLGCYPSILAADGPQVEWLKTYALGQRDLPGGMALDGQGNIIVSYTKGMILMVEKFDRTGQKVWAIAHETQGILEAVDRMAGIAADRLGNVFFNCVFTGSLKVLGQEIKAAGPASDQRIVLKYSPDGKLAWWRIVGPEQAWFYREGNPWDNPRSKPVTDALGNLFIATQLAKSNGLSVPNIRLQKFSPEGQTLWSGGGSGWASAAALDAAGSLYFCGQVDFDNPVLDGMEVNPGPLVAKYTPAGVPAWADSSGADIRDIAVNGNRLVAAGARFPSGVIRILDLDRSLVREINTGPSAFAYSVGSSIDDGFLFGTLITDGRYYNSDGSIRRLHVEKRNSGGDLLWQRAFVGTNLWPRGVGQSAAGEIYVFGGFRGEAYFDIDAGLKTFSHEQGVFLAKLSAEGDVRPQITNAPIAQTVPLGGAAEFSVGVQSALPVSYQWFLNESPIPSATNAVLHFSATLPGDAGDYSVEVSNDQGKVRSQPAALAFRGRVRVMVTTLAGNGSPGYVDSANRNLVRFNRPNGLYYFANGLIAVADGYNHVIRLLELNGSTGTYAGTGEQVIPMARLRAPSSAFRSA